MSDLTNDSAIAAARRPGDSVPWGLWALIGLLFAGLLPYAANYVTHHPDERHYTNAAIEMLDSGDYLTPRYPDGTARFQKPILSYWLVAGAYRVLGVSPLASRLPFLLVGCGVVWLTYRLGLLVLEDRRAAVVAAAIAACNPLLLVVAPLSIPDIVLCFLVVLSAYGFLGLIAMGRRSPGFYWAAYVGTGLAVATKGLPALSFAGVAWLFALANPRARVKPRELIHLPSMILGGMLAGGWFLLMYSIHGEEAMAVFFTDQVTGRVSPSGWRVLGHTLLGAAVIAGTLFPWNLVATKKGPGLFCRNGPKGASHKINQVPFSQQTQARRLILAWAGMMALMMGTVVNFYPRYALPVLPIVAVALADVLRRADAEVVARRLRLALAGGLVVLTAIGLLAAGINGLLDMGLQGLLLPLMVLVLGAVLTAWARRRAWQDMAVALAAIVMLMPLTAYLALRHLALPDQGTQIARALLNHPAQRAAAYYVGHPSLAARIRVCSGGRLTIHSGSAERPDEYRRFDYVVLPEEERANLDLREYRVERASTGTHRLPPLQLARAAFQGRLADYLRSRRRHFLLAVRAARCGGTAVHIAETPQPPDRGVKR